MHESPVQPHVNFATGGWSTGAVTVTVCVAVALCPAVSMTVSVTWYVPAAA